MASTVYLLVLNTELFTYHMQTNQTQGSLYKYDVSNDNLSVTLFIPERTNSRTLVDKT